MIHSRFAAGNQGLLAMCARILPTFTCNTSRNKFEEQMRAERRSIIYNRNRRSYIHRDWKTPWALQHIKRRVYTLLQLPLACHAVASLHLILIDI